MATRKISFMGQSYLHENGTFERTGEDPFREA